MANDENKKELDSPTQEQLYHAFTTLPVTPHQIHVSFKFQGIPESYKNIEAHVEACRKRGVMPFTHLSLRWNDDAGLYVPNNSDGICRVSSAFAPQAIHGLLKGGKFHSVSLEAFYPGMLHVWDNFTKEMAPRMREEGYNIGGYSELWIESIRYTGYNEGWDSDSRIIYRGEEKPKLSLEIGYRMQKKRAEEAERVSRWFGEIGKVSKAQLEMVIA